MYTTLNKIRVKGPCMGGWKTLLRFLGKTGPDDEPISVLTVLKSNGIDDAIWCLRAVDGFDREKRLFAVKCARRVQHLMTDQRSLNALDVAEAYANGLASDEELGKAWEAAQAAREAAWEAAQEAAQAAQAAREAARESAAQAAREAAWEAARSAWAAAWVAAWSASAAAARAAWVAAWEAARAARSALAAAAWVDTAATGSWGTEEESEREFQNNLFIEMFSLTQEEK